MISKLAKYDIPFLKAMFPKHVVDSLHSIFSSGYVGAGKKVQEFENHLSKFLSRDGVLCTSSCTAALTLAYKLAGISQGTKVLTTPMTCAATNIPLLHLGAEIRWVDVDPITGNVTPETLSLGLKHNPDCRIVVIMDWGGMPCNYREIEQLTSEHNVTLVLDGAQSFGSKYLGSYSGSSAHFVCYSFGPTKILSSVEGGAIATANKKLIPQIRKLSWHGIDRSSRDSIRFWEYQVETAGYRFISNDVFASIGINMLRLLPERIVYHRRIAKRYQLGLKNVPGVTLPPSPYEVVSNYWMFTILVENRRELIRKLHSLGIHAAIPHSRNDHLLCFKSDSNDFPQLSGVDYFSKHYLCLPIGPWVSIEMVDQICKEISSGW